MILSQGAVHAHLAKWPTSNSVPCIRTQGQSSPCSFLATANVDRSQQLSLRPSRATRAMPPAAASQDAQPLAESVQVASQTALLSVTTIQAPSGEVATMVGGPTSQAGTSQQPEQARMAASSSLPHVLILHTGGTLGMDPQILQGSDTDASGMEHAGKGLRPATMLANVLSVVPELSLLSDVHFQVCFNKDSSRVGPAEWIQIARILHDNRDAYDGFLIIHGTDTLAYTASALSLMLQGFNKPVVLTGSQLPLAAPRTDARQNLLDSIQCATAAFSPPHVCLKEVAVCFGGRLMRGNRTRKVHSMLYQAFDSPGYPYLAQLGIDVAWNEEALLRPSPSYRPRFELCPHVMRVPVVPGLDPRQAYGDLVARGVKGVVLELFGVGNIPDLPEMGWMPWLESQMDLGLQVVPVSQCAAGPLHQDMYAAGGALSALTSKHAQHTVEGGAVVTGAEAVQRAGGSMTPECAVVKLMLTLANPSLAVGRALAGEL